MKRSFHAWPAFLGPGCSSACWMAVSGSGLGRQGHHEDGRLVSCCCIQLVLGWVLPKLMRRAGFSLLGLLVLIAANPLWAQSKPTNPQPAPPGTAPAQNAAPVQNEAPNGTSVPGSLPGEEAKAPLQVKEPAASSAPVPSDAEGPSEPKQPKTEILDT